MFVSKGYVFIVESYKYVDQPNLLKIKFELFLTVLYSFVNWRMKFHTLGFRGMFKLYEVMLI